MNDFQELFQLWGLWNRGQGLQRVLPWLVHSPPHCEPPLCILFFKEGCCWAPGYNLTLRTAKDSRPVGHLAVTESLALDTGYCPMPKSAIPLAFPCRASHSTWSWFWSHSARNNDFWLGTLYLSSPYPIANCTYFKKLIRWEYGDGAGGGAGQQ